MQGFFCALLNNQGGLNMNTAPDTPTTTDRLIRLKELLEIVPLGRSTVWKLVSEGRFPKPVKLSPRTTAWRESEVMDWMDSL
jgi:prophage regulatory protein